MPEVKITPAERPRVGALARPYLEYRDGDQRLIGVVSIPASTHELPEDHFENASRTDEMLRLLRRQPFWPELHLLIPRVAAKEELVAVHDRRYVDLVETASAGPDPGWLDNDTLVGPGSYDGASLAAGGVMAGIDAVLSLAYSRLDHVFALVRPAGHHAGVRRARGSCIFNNVAIGARYAQAEYGLERIAIVDWDVHHGNGTQEIFYADPSVLFCSLHEYPGYPGNAGTPEEIGEGQGRGLNINIPMTAGASDAAYLHATDDVVLPVLEAWRPQLVLVCVGHDIHAFDPMADIDVTAQGIQQLTTRLRDAAERLGTSAVFVLEGGYNQSTLPELTTALVAALGEFDYDVDDPAHPGIDLRPEDTERVVALRRALREHWPFLDPGTQA
jgi:acetoin utilization deacetylase AcuC-like enzyme